MPYFTAECSYNEDTTFKIDFNSDFDLTYTTPERFSYFDEEAADTNLWAALYVNVMATIIDDYPYIFHPGMSFGQNSSRIDLAGDDNYGSMISPKPIPGTGYMLETNLCANAIASKIRYVLDLCCVDYENVVITYRKKAEKIPEETHPEKSLGNDALLEVNSKNFFRYLSETAKLANDTCRGYVSAINNCEVFAKEHQLSSWQLYTTDRQTSHQTIQLLLSNADFLSYNKKQHDRLGAALKKFLGFIDSELTLNVPLKADSKQETVYKNERYESVLMKHFKKGFRMNSPLEIRKFRNYYIKIHSTELTDSDDDIAGKIKMLCILYEGKAYLPDAMLSDELKEKLLNYIEAAFSDGKKALYYQAIFTEFADAFLDYHIHDGDTHRFCVNTLQYLQDDI